MCSREEEGEHGTRMPVRIISTFTHPPPPPFPSTATPLKNQQDGRQSFSFHKRKSSPLNSSIFFEQQGFFPSSLLHLLPRFMYTWKTPLPSTFVQDKDRFLIGAGGYAYRLDDWMAYVEWVNVRSPSQPSFARTSLD